MDIEAYNQKRNFVKTSEPKGKRKESEGNLFVVQEHFSSRHHFDFRLELDGVLKSWAVPKGPSTNPKDKRLAVHVEDHPLEYANFEGTIPKGEYGAGEVIIWDKGQWLIEEDALRAYREGKLEFELKGNKLKGRWVLVKTKMGNSKQENWLLMKKEDDFVNKSPHQTRQLNITPQLATAQEQAPKSDNYIHELKYDGYRIFAAILDNEVQLYSRNSKNWTYRFPQLAHSLKSPNLNDTILDGEIVCLDEKGLTSFEDLQNSIKKKSEEGLYYYLFDVLQLRGKDVQNKKQEERKKLVKDIVSELGNDRIRYSEHFVDDGEKILEKCCELGAEGIISKKKDAPYESSRNENWIKVKCNNQDEFIIIGFTERKGSHNEVGSLVLGLNGPQALEEVGKVGTGFNRKQRRELYQKLSKLTRKTPPVETELKDRDVNWTTPKLMAQIKYNNFTKSNKLRHSVYIELREDKEIDQARFPLNRFKKEEYSEQELKQRITSESKVLWPDSQITKLDLAAYYNHIYRFMKDHLNNKILSLLKCPQGIKGKCFFNKHPGNMKRLKTFTVTHKDKKQNYFTIKNLEGLIYLVRYNSLEIHTWNARAGREVIPDEMVFDLDPHEELNSKEVIESAFELKETLQMLDLESFPKITGGKGLHLHIPLALEHTTEQVYKFAKSIAYILEEESPDRYTSNSRFSKRKGKIFVDYMRNSFGATYICPFSTRVKPHAPLALPLSWKELNNYDINDPVTLKSFLRSKKNGFQHPWQDYWDIQQVLDVFH